MELLVAVRDKSDHPDAFPKFGDVIAACPPGHPWSPAELLNPDWRVVVVPELSDLEARGLTVPEPDDLNRNPGRHVRAFRLSLPADTRGCTAHVGKLELSLPALRSLRARKPPKPSPTVTR